VTEDELRALVEQCAPYIDAAQLSYDQLMDEIAKSREETQGMFSQYLKEAFYVEKTVALQKAELDVLREKGGIIVQGVLAAVEATYDAAIASIEQIRLQLLNPEGAYQRALTSFREKKTEFLNYRESVLSCDDDTGVEQHVERLNQIKDELEQVENALISAGDTAHEMLDTVRDAITGAYTSIVNSIKSVLSSFNNFLDEIETAQETASVEISATFETEYGTYVLNAKADWNEMRVELTKTVDAE
jgi:archaellum component FlaC